jgi:hypothetical protein
MATSEQNLPVPVPASGAEDAASQFRFLQNKSSCRVVEVKNEPSPQEDS